MKTKFKLLLGNRFPLLPMMKYLLDTVLILELHHSSDTLHKSFLCVCPNKQRRQFSITTRANNNFTKVKYHLYKRPYYYYYHIVNTSQYIYSGNAFYIFHTSIRLHRSPSTQHWNIFHDQMISHKIEFLPFMLWINYYVCAWTMALPKTCRLALTSVLWSVKIKCLSLTWVVIYKINVKK